MCEAGREPTLRRPRWACWPGVVGVFSSAGPDDEAAEREEFGVADRGETELQRDTSSGFVPSESADLARHELDALEAPPDSAP